MNIEEDNRLWFIKRIVLRSDNARRLSEAGAQPSRTSRVRAAAPVIDLAAVLQAAVDFDRKEACGASRA